MDPVAEGIVLALPRIVFVQSGRDPGPIKRMQFDPPCDNLGTGSHFGQGGLEPIRVNQPVGVHRQEDAAGACNANGGFTRQAPGTARICLPRRKFDLDDVQRGAGSERDRPRGSSSGISTVVGNNYYVMHLGTDLAVKCFQACCDAGRQAHLPALGIGS
nr:hypothetical protein [Acidisphaera sp. L21]